MNSSGLFTSGGSADWLVFAGVLLAVCVVTFGIVIWVMLLRKRGKKSSRKHRKHQHRHTNPTLAETGGLPPIRESDQPPRGP
jgi:type VI protein secretion system component VasK